MMIRSPASAIDLAQADIDTVLRELQIREQLYAQGFTKDEARKYIDDERCNKQNSVPSYIILPHHSTPSPVCTFDTPTTEDTPNRPKWQTRMASDSRSDRRVSGENTPTTPNEPPSSPVTQPSSPRIQITLPLRQTTVRQPSLLRHVHTAGSASSLETSGTGGDVDRRDNNESGSYNDGSSGFLTSPATRSRRYRARISTYSYIESDAEAPTPQTGSPRSFSSNSQIGNPIEPDNGSDSASLASADNDRARGLRSAASVPSSRMVPRRLNYGGPLRSERTRASTPFPTRSHGQDLSGSGSDQTSSEDGIVNTNRTSSQLLPPFPDLPTTRGRISIPMPSSPPSQFRLTPAEQNRAVQQSSFSPSSSPSLPPIPPSPAIRLTAPQTPSRRSLFPVSGTMHVYNDRLAAELQPQTPADLQSPRQRNVLADSVAYTAPPGQIRTAGRLVGAGHDDVGPGGMPSTDGLTRWLRHAQQTGDVAELNRLRELNATLARARDQASAAAAERARSAEQRRLRQQERERMAQATQRRANASTFEVRDESTDQDQSPAPEDHLGAGGLRDPSADRAARGAERRARSRERREQVAYSARPIAQLTWDSDLRTVEAAIRTNWREGLTQDQFVRTYLFLWNVLCRRVYERLMADSGAREE